MASTARTILVPAVTVMTLVTGLTACGGESDKAAAPAKAAGANRPRAMMYDGKQLPGLPRTPAWTLPGRPGGASVIAVGDAFAVVTGGPRATEPPSGGKDAETPTALREGPKVIEFRDAGTGTVRQTVRADDASVSADTWHGRPALRVNVTTRTASDGMTSDKSTTVSEVYDARGRKLGRVPRDESHWLSDGWVRGGTERSVAPAEGGPEQQVDGSGPFANLRGPVEETLGARRTFAGGYGFSFEEVERGLFNHPKRLVVSELSTGKKAWTSSEAGRPGQALPEEKSHATNVLPLTVIGDKIVLAWQTKGGEHDYEEPWIMSVNDLRTGRLLTTGPVVQSDASNFARDENADSDPFFYVTYDPSSGLIATAGKQSYQQSTTVWDVNSGKRLWAQDKDEKPFLPLTAGNGVLYGYTDRNASNYSSPIAVDLRTKKVLDKDVDKEHIPVFSADGHAAIAIDQGVFVFPVR